MTTTETETPVTQVLILCAGDATRWGNYRGVPKQLVDVFGEPILHRTVRLIKDLAPGADIGIVVKPGADPEFDVPDTRRIEADLNPANRDADKFLSSREHWSTTGRTVLLYGDCFLTTEAMRQILDPRPLPDGWAVYARFGASQLTGTPWGENFAHVIDPHVHTAWDAALRSLPTLTEGWQGGRCGGHEQYMLMEFGDPCQYQRLGPHGVHIDDWSDDFDYPTDYDRWCYRYVMADPTDKDRAI